MGAARPDERIRVAEVMAALSLATDLGLGRPLGHELGVCLSALDLADRLGCGARERSDVYYVALLAQVGCTAAAPELASWVGGDEIHLQRGAQALGPASEPVEDLRHLLPHLADDRPLPERARLVVGVLASRAARRLRVPPRGRRRAARRRSPAPGRGRRLRRDDPRPAAPGRAGRAGRARRAGRDGPPGWPRQAGHGRRAGRRGRGAGRGPPGQPAGLTDREVEVLRLVAQGRTNKEIARALVIAEKTAGHHVEHVYAKAGVSTRAGAALFAMRHDLVG